MNNKLYVVGLISLMACLNGITWSMADDLSIKNIITYYEADVPSNLVDDQQVDALIRELRKKFPEELQIGMIREARGRIFFLERKNALIQLKKVVNYENVALLVGAILTIDPEKPDAILFTKIAKGGGTIILRAKVVDTKTKIRAESRVEFQQSDAFITDKLNSKIRDLAKDLLEQIPPPPSPIQDKDAPRFLNSSTISSGIIAVGSFSWYLIEDGNVNDGYKKYKSATLVEDVTRFRIETEKSLTRRKIAKRSAIISGIAFGLFLLRDTFWYNDRKANNKKVGPDKGENAGKGIRFDLNHSISNERISIKMELSF